MHKQANQINIQESIELIYDAVTRPELWKELVHTLVRDSGSNSGMLCVEKRDHSAVLTYNDTGYDDKAIANYADHFVTKDIWLQCLDAQPTNVFYSTYDLCPQKEYLNSEFYSDWEGAQNMHHATGAYIATESELALRFCMQRSNKEGHYRREEIAVLNQIAPHLKRAVKLHGEFAKLNLLNQSTTKILDQLPFAALLLDAQCNIQYRNAKADDLLFEGTILRETNKQLLLDTQDQACFSRMVINAIEAGQGGQSIDSNVLRVLNENETVLEVSVSPFSIDDYQFCFQYRKVMALVMLKAVTQTQEINLHAISRLYSLTKREAFLARLLCQGMKLDQIAELSHISQNTARTHMKSMLQKTNTNSQAQLIVKILSGVTPLISE